MLTLSQHRYKSPKHLCSFIEGKFVGNQMYWNLFDVFVNVFCFAQFDYVKTRTMSFVVDWTGRAQLIFWTWFQVMLLTIWLPWWHCIGIVFHSLFNFGKQTIKLIIDSVSLKVICWKQNAMKFVRSVCDCVCIYFALHSLTLLSPKYSSFFCRWTDVELSGPQLPFVIRGASASAPSSAGSHSGRRVSGKSRLRPNAAARGGGKLPRRGCGAVAEQRRRRGRQGQRWPGPPSGKHAPDIESRIWGTSICFFLEILRNMFAFSVNPKHAKNVGINDHI